MNQQFLTASRTDVGLKRKLNEDSMLDRSDSAMWVVADGMGGHEAGEVASSMIVGAMAELAVEPKLDGTVAAVNDALQGVHAHLILMARGGSTPMTIGSTVVGLVIARGEYRCFWVGDSRAYLVRGRDIAQITRDHSLVQDLVDAKLLDPADAEKHPDANVITRAVGADKELVVDVVSGKAAAGDLFLLCSDGVSKVMEPDEIMAELTTKNPKQAIAAMSETILARGAPDNFTAVVVRVL